jgi:predicted choloylglycine hydrolase
VTCSHRNRWIILIFAGLLSTYPLRAQTPFRFPEGKHGNGELKYEKGIPILRVEGSSEEMGEQIAALAVKPAKRVLDYPENIMERLDIAALLPILAWAGQSMLPQFPADHHKELDAIVQAGVERRPMVLGNTMFDLKQMFACSALVVNPSRSQTNGVLVGRNLDFPSLGYIQEYSLVTIYHSPGKHTFASIGFPGLVGCLSGMNDAGLCLGILEVAHVKKGEKKFDGTGTPFALCYRRLLEECATVEEAEKLLKSMKRTTLTNLVIGDPKHTVIFEITPQSLIVRQPEDGLGSCTNHFCSPQLKPARQPDVFWTHERFDELEKARKLPKVGIEDMHKSLHAVSVRNHTLQTMIFEPAKLRLHLAIGACPASAKELTTLNLGPMFKKNASP